MSAAARNGIAPTKAWPLTPLLSLNECHRLPTSSAGREAPVTHCIAYSGGPPTTNIRSDRDPHSPTTSPATLPSKISPVAAAAPKMGRAYIPSPSGLQSEKNVPSDVGCTLVCQASCIVVSNPVLAIRAPAPKAAVRQTRLSHE
jgi:hypothetical protein